MPAAFASISLKKDHALSANFSPVPINKTATVTLVVSALSVALGGCSFFGKQDDSKTYLVRENYTLTTKVVTPLNNGISQSPTAKQPVLIELDSDDSPTVVAQPVFDHIVQWRVYEKPYPTPAFSEGIAGAGMVDGIIESVYFDKNSTEPIGISGLKALSEKLAMIGGTVTVVGHTDQAEYRHNPDLGKERAIAIADELKSLGVPEGRIVVKNGGATRVYAPAAKDRCVNIILKVR